MGRRSLSQELEQARARTDEFFETLSPEAFYERPIPERHRLIFYLGHVEAFDWNQICRWTLGMSSFHESFDQLFEAGIDPPVGELAQDQPSDWPSIREVQAYNQQIRGTVDRVLDDAPESVIHIAIEHRLMHAETNAYLLHHLDSRFKSSGKTRLQVAGPKPEHAMVDIPAGQTILGRDLQEGFGWDNEFQAHTVQVPAFSMSRYKVTNSQYLQFVQEGGDPPAMWVRQGDTWLLRTMFETVPLPPHWPVYVTHGQARAYALWAGMALPTEAQFHRAAFGGCGQPDAPFPWGTEAPTGEWGNFNFAGWDPVPVTSHPRGQSRFGVAQLVGNGWEWTSTPFGPFEGFQPLSTYPGYSSRFFDDDHFVVKGGGPQTAARLLRRSLRNWFRQEYPYAHTGFRCVQAPSSF